MNRRCLFLSIGCALLVFSPVSAQIYEESPIRYSRRTPGDIAASWSRTLPVGEPKFDHSSPKAFLKSVLDELDISPTSQLLVFSTTSFQNKKIDGARPRALYFNENHYVGFVQGGPVELATTDSRMGVNFYTMSVPKPNDLRGPTLHRDPACITCHAGNSQSDFPGLMALSVFSTEEGSQVLQGTTHVVDDTQDIHNRWGGWYVTGQVEGPRHRGNAYYLPTSDRDADPKLEKDFGLTVKELSGQLDMEPYLANTSDVVALLVFEHQLHAHNQLVEAFGHSRIAIYADDEYMAGGELQPKTLAVMDAEIEDLLEVMLFSEEADLAQHQIKGSTAYQTAFQENAQRDEAGRSLKDFNLDDRLFQYRLSYMIYSEAFDHLPEQFQERFFTRLEEVLDGSPEEDRFKHLPVEERQAIKSILEATLPQPFDS